eukprot:gene2066-18250_t
MMNAESSSSAPNAAAAASAPLPPLPRLPAKEMAGPTAWSNWVIRGRVMAGAYPASLNDTETDQILTTLLELGVNTFVCLQAEVNIHCPESSWRNQRGLRPYIKDAQKLLGKAHETADPKIQQQKIDFLHLPIIDGNVTTDNAMHKLAEDCIQRVLQGENLYIHCWGGHGRTGTLVSVMLGRMYGLPYTAAMRYCQAFHNSRQYPQGVNSPQTPVQRAQAFHDSRQYPQGFNSPLTFLQGAQVRRLLALQPGMAPPGTHPGSPAAAAAVQGQIAAAGRLSGPATSPVAAIRQLAAAGKLSGAAASPVAALRQVAAAGKPSGQALRPAVGAGPAARPQGAVGAAGSSAYGVGSGANGGTGSAHSGGAAAVGARVSPVRVSAAAAVGSQPGVGRSQDPHSQKYGCVQPVLSVADQLANDFTLKLHAPSAAVGSMPGAGGEGKAGRGVAHLEGSNVGHGKHAYG